VFGSISEPVHSQDSEIRKNFQRSLTKQGFKFKLGYKVTGARLEGDVVKLSVENVKDGKSEEVEANVVLVSAGAPLFGPEADAGVQGLPCAQGCA